MRGSKKACAGPVSGEFSRAAATLGNSLRRLARPGGRCSGGAGTRGTSGLGNLFVLARGSRSPAPSGSTSSVTSSLESSAPCTAPVVVECLERSDGREVGGVLDTSLRCGVCNAAEEA